MVVVDLGITMVVEEAVEDIVIMIVLVEIITVQETEEEVEVTRITGNIKIIMTSKKFCFQWSTIVMVLFECQISSICFTIVIMY